MKNITQVALGILTAIGGFLEIGTTATSVEAGASFRFSLIWALVLGAICLIFLIEMTGRHAAVSKHSLAGAVRERQRDDESCPFSESFALGANLAVMQLDDVSRDRQSESQAASLRRSLGLTQSLEHMRQKRRIDSFAVIADSDARVTIDAIELQIDPSAGRRELDRVREDVADHLLHSIRIGVDDVGVGLDR